MNPHLARTHVRRAIASAKATRTRLFRALELLTPGTAEFLRVQADHREACAQLRTLQRKTLPAVDRLIEQENPAWPS